MKRILLASIAITCLVSVFGCKKSDDTAGQTAADGAAAATNTTPATKPEAKAGATAATGQATLGPGAGGADTRVGTAGSH